MAVEKWTAGSGQGLTWGNAFSTSTATGVPALANGSAILSTISITNGTALDVFADVSMSSTFPMALLAPLYVGIYIYPLNEDGTTYGDGTITSTGSQAIVPSGQYYAGAISVPSTVGSTVRSVVGQVDRLVLPPGTFSFAAYNQLGVALSTVFTIQYRTYNRSVA